MIDIKRGIQQKQNALGLRKALPDCLDHCLAQGAAGLGNSWRIHENDLGLGRGKDTHNLVAGCLGPGSYYGNLLAQNGIEQS